MLPFSLTFWIPIFDSLTLLLTSLTTASYAVTKEMGGTILTTDPYLVIHTWFREERKWEKDKRERNHKTELHQRLQLHLIKANVPVLFLNLYI